MHRCLSSSLLRRGDGAAWSTALCAVASRLPLLPAVACRRASGAGGGGGGGGGGNYRPGGARGESAGGFTFPAGDAGDGGDAELLDDGDEENEEGAEDELEFDSDVDEPAVVAARNSKIRAATRMEWDARVPGDYRALSEARAYEATLAAAADSRLEDMEASDLPPATGPLPISRGGRGGAAGASSKAQPRRGSELLLRSGPRLSGADATEELLNNLHASPDALDRVQLSSADARITSLDADPYSWPARHSKEAPRWMLYEAQREEVRLVDGSQNADKKRTAQAAALRPPMRDALNRAYATGRRKTAVARVWVRPGEGSFSVNGRTLADYFHRSADRVTAMEPLISSQTAGAFDVMLTVEGGGLTGQAGAIKHGLAGALSRYDPYLKPGLQRAGLLFRDPRTVERKKPGQKKARRKFQWVKR